MAKDLRITFLLDFYGDMLTEKQREVVECYYNEDLSLAEIAEEKGITRQGVRDGIKRAEHGDGLVTLQHHMRGENRGWVLQSASAACRKN